MIVVTKTHRFCFWIHINIPTLCFHVCTGHISVASNIPVDEWEDEDMIENILKEHVSDKKAVVVFHCMYSQQRGPFCASR